MSELIKALVDVKDPFTLFAFLAVVLLVAFRTRTVPESLFRLLGEKITRERFYRLINRSLVYTFAVFLVLCGIAIAGQILEYKTTARAASLEELRLELQSRGVEDVAGQRALDEYEKGLASREENQLADAIASLEASLSAVPTLTARETLALLYAQAGHRERAVQTAEQAVSAAHASGGAVARARAERLLNEVSSSAAVRVSEDCPPDAGLVGRKLDLPPGGQTLEAAPPLLPCVYQGIVDSEGDQWSYYRVSVPAEKTVSVVMRSRDRSAPRTEVRLHGPNGANLGSYYTRGESVVTKPLVYSAERSEAVFVGMKGGVQGAALAISVQ